MNKTIHTTITIAAFIFTSCGDSATKSNTVINNESTVVESDLKGQSQYGLTEISLNSDDRMTFDQSEIIVLEGHMIKLTLRHTGQMPKTAMGHNFVLLHKDVNFSDFASEAAKSSAPDYNLPETLLNKVIVSTKMIGGGESVTVEFKAPSKGTYEFLCSFPGHSSMMKGKFIVN